MSEYKGLATKNIYKFGLERMYGYVDSRDIESLLEITEDGKWVFECQAME
ncbi:MAG: hypothetical protein WC373_06725 [Smithella sp.]